LLESVLDNIFVLASKKRFLMCLLICGICYFSPRR
jgi:hypothetical protein